MNYAFLKNDTVLKILILTALVLTLEIQLATFDNDKDSNHVHGLDNKSLSDFNIAAAGDWACSDNTKNTANNIIAKNPELVLGLGDYAYNNDAGCWLEIIGPIADKMKIVIGNHDDTMSVDGNYLPAPKRLQQYMSYFNLSKQFYSFDYQNVHFVAMSTEQSFKKGSMQYRFVERDLKNASSDPNINWIIVFYHRVAYSSPSEVGAVTDLRDTYHPLFEKYGVDVVLQAHNHHYQRSYPIRYNSGDSSDPIVTIKSITNYFDPKGQIFTIVGTGGAHVIHNFTGEPAEFTARQFYGYGFLNLDVIDNGTTLVGEFHDNDKTIKDRFSITKPTVS